ncbi:magnesium chelatase subunit ChlI family protein, partial [Amycolatopsis sp. NPDC003676]
AGSLAKESARRSRRRTGRAWAAWHLPGTGDRSEQVETSASVAARVRRARGLALERWSADGWTTNAEVPGHVLRQRFRLPRESIAPIETALRLGRMSARGADRAIRVAWTVCDLRGGEIPSVQDVLSALNFRQRGAQ